MVLKARSRRRRLARALALATMGAVLLLATLPGWLPWILKPLAGRFGLFYAQYTREGYQRFELSELSFAGRSGQFQARRVRAYVPTVWLWRCWFGSKSEPFLEADAWSWNQSASAPASPSASAYGAFQQTRAVAVILKNWLPKAEAGEGAIRVKDQVFSVSQADWSAGVLSAKAEIPRYELSIAVRATVGLDGLVKINLESDEPGVRSELVIADSESGAALNGTVFWQSNRLELSALFPRHGVVPDTARLRADPFVVPARMLRLEEYGDLAGTLGADWRSNRFNLNLEARATARGENSLPPIDIEARCSGDTRAVQIDEARISSPWLNAELSGPTALQFEPPFLPQSVALNLTANLDQQPWLAARGRLAGQAVLRPSRSRFPQVDFTLAGANVVVSNVTARSAHVQGEFLWPQLNLAQASFETADGSTVSLRGTFDLQSHTVEEGRLNFSGGFGREYLPAGISFHSASLFAQFAGPWRALTNAARLEVDSLQLPRTKPLRLDAEWNGVGTDLRQLQLTLAAGESTLRLRGSAEWAGRRTSAAVTALELGRGEGPELRLQQPFAFTWQAGTAGSNRWTLALQPVVCSTEGRRLEVEADIAWPVRGSFHGRAQGLDDAWLRDFLQVNLPDVRVNELACTGGWSNGPMAFELGAKAELTTRQQSVFAANLDVTGGSNGMVIGQFSVACATQAVCRAQGSLPLVLEPANTSGPVRVLPEDPLRLRLATESNSILWDELAAISGALLDQPHLEADLDGTWAAPEGHVLLQARRIRFPQVRRPLPVLENLDLALSLDRVTARLSRLDVSVEGQPVRITAEMPLEKDLERIARMEWPDWSNATARVTIEKAQLAPFARYLPGVLSPAGEARADVRLEPGGILSGQIVLSNAATRPLTEVGAIRDIQAETVFAGRTLRLKEASAEIGGRRLTARGSVDLSELPWQSRQLPPFEIRLGGTDVPLARRPGLVLRADLDLGVVNRRPGPPVVAGTVTLRDGLFLADLKSLVPERSAAPAQRPPYFSVEEPPWADWRLQVEVTGEGFMRVQTPLFRGRLSTTLKLSHTLKEPLALGEVKVQSGSITLPFGSLDVKHGFVSLTSRDPYHPQLDLSAAAERYGYDLRLAVTGPADAPVVLFTSSPPLSSEQIVLMLTTGQLPRGVGVSSSAGQRAQGLGLFLGQNVLSGLGLGTSDKERLVLRSGERLSETGRTTYEVEYGLSDDVSLLGGYDRFDQYNLNLKWKVFSR